MAEGGAPEVPVEGEGSEQAPAQEPADPYVVGANSPEDIQEELAFGAQPQVMSKALFTALEITPGRIPVELVWNHIKKAVLSDIMACRHYQPVEFLKEAMFIEPFTVIGKKKGSVLKSRCYVNLGVTLQDLIPTYQPPKFEFDPYANKGEPLINNYKYFITRTEGPVCKTVQLEIDAPEVYSIRTLPPATIPADKFEAAFNFYNLGEEKIYIVQAIIYANKFRMKIRIGGDAIVKEWPCRVPIAFQLKKYKVNADHTLDTKAPIKHGNSLLNRKALFKHYFVSPDETQTEEIEDFALEPIDINEKFVGLNDSLEIYRNAKGIGPPSEETSNGPDGTSVTSPPVMPDLVLDPAICSTPDIKIKRRSSRINSASSENPENPESPPEAAGGEESSPAPEGINQTFPQDNTGPKKRKIRVPVLPPWLNLEAKGLNPSHIIKYLYSESFREALGLTPESNTNDSFLAWTKDLTLAGAYYEMYCVDPYVELNVKTRRFTLPDINLETKL